MYLLFTLPLPLCCIRPQITDYQFKIFENRLQFAYCSQFNSQELISISIHANCKCFLMDVFDAESNIIELFRFCSEIPTYTCRTNNKYNIVVPGV